MSFLNYVAETLWGEYGNDIHRLTIVFPNRRAGLFFGRALARVAGRPVLSPEIITINQLFAQLSTLVVADNIELLVRLYDVYTQYYLCEAHLEESFDEFLFWGKMMLGDFSEADQHLVDVDRLFSNIVDLKDIDIRFADMGESERAAIKRFAEGFEKDADNHLRKQFINIWRCLKPIYHNFKQQLQKEGLAYAGMLCREVVSSPTLDTDNRQFVFVGFNALTGCERLLMQRLQAARQAQFFWDYSAEWLRDKNNIASTYFESNIKLFPPKQPMPVNSTYPRLHLIEIASLTGQAREAGQVLSTIGENPVVDWTRIGVVLADDSMLEAVIDNLPKQVPAVNITMGQSLKTCPVFSLISHLSELQLLSRTNNEQVLFYHKPVLALLNHPYIVSELSQALAKQMLKDNMSYVKPEMFAQDELLSHVFCRVTASQQVLAYVSDLLHYLIADELSDATLLRNEYIYRALLVVNHLNDIFAQRPALISEPATAFRLILSLLSADSIPFEGEPLVGLQVMGTLESRGMDFQKLILLSVNDDVLPGQSTKQSYIPYELRRAYGLPTKERQDAIFAYNFYRLIAGSDEVWLIANTSADDNHSGELSRYIYQLRYQYNINLPPKVTTQSVMLRPTPSIHIDKTPQVLREIQQRLCLSAGSDRKHTGLSPSALNTYVSCPLRFYWQYIRRLHEPDKIKEDIEINEFGTIVHQVLEILYQPFSTPRGQDLQRNKVNAENIDAMLGRVKSTNIVEKVYQDILKRNDSELEGKDFLPVFVAKKYIERVLEYDKRLAPFFYIASEMPCEAFVEVDNRQVYLKGVIDRVDEVNGQIRIIDYKTGSEKNTFQSLDGLYTEADEKSDHVRQTLTYCLIFKNSQQSATDFFPHIYYTKQTADKDFDVEIPRGKDAPHGYAAMQKGFTQALTGVLKEIFSPDVPFIQKPDYNKKCKYCPFKSVCDK